MELVKEFDIALKELSTFETSCSLERIQAELKFAWEFAALFEDRKAEWQNLVLEAVRTLCLKLSASGADTQSAIAEAERTLSPIGKAAKEYTVHCCGHAHIDMNWLWPWQETVSVSHDTFMTVDRLLDEFPEFHFSQSQASTYAAMEEYCPEIFEMIKRRIQEGRWEPTASTWVEGDKNLASGEILCRHLLYTRRYFEQHFGLPYDTVKIDWSPDTFGHAHTLPTILAQGGVSRYYHCRTGPNKWLLRWQGPDGSRVLLFLDKAWYNGKMDTDLMVTNFIDYVRETDLNDYLFVYVVGDHGGGPTRKDLMKAMEIAEWPIFPRVILSTTDAYFSAVEAANPDLPVHDGELNFTLEGCYTSQSNIKRANRVSENILPEVEAISVVANAVAGFPYPTEDLRRGWRMAMFNQFHDILPGSGIHATYEHAQGLFQEIQAISGSIRTRALRRLASLINTSAASGIEVPTGSLGASVGDGLGAGVGDPSLPGGVSARNAGAVSGEPVVVFNQSAFPRSEVVETKVWDKKLPMNRIVVRDDKGNLTPGQVVATGDYWNHDYTTVIFQAEDVPGLGYRTYTIDTAPQATAPERRTSLFGSPGAGFVEQKIDFPAPEHTVTWDESGVMENEFVRVEVDFPSAAIKHLIDKSTGCDLVPEGELLAVLELYQEAPHGMSAWVIGQTPEMQRLDKGGFFIDKNWGYDIQQKAGLNYFPPQEYLQDGPHRAAFRIGQKIGRESQAVIEIGLNAGSPVVDFKFNIDWREVGTRNTGVPMLKIAFPVDVTDPKATYEIPFGSIERPLGEQEVPALRWADISDGTRGLTLVNADKYGHSAEGRTLRLTLLRSSYEPDPFPEVGDHEIRLAIMPHAGGCSVSEATRFAAAFNLPMSVVSTDVHEGDLPGTQGFAKVLTPNVMLSAIKKAEDSDALVVRIYEMEGKDTEARLRLSGLVKPGASAQVVDLMEQPLAETSARMEGDTLVTSIPAHGFVSVLIR